MNEPISMKVNDVEYVRKDSVLDMAPKYDGMEYVLVRTYSAGVHVGYLKSRDGKELTLVSSRRIWYWDGANSISQLAVDGTKSPKNCKFTCEVAQITLTEAIEIIVCTKAAKESIDGVKVWVK